MKIKDSFKGIFLLMIAEQAAFALPPTTSDFCLEYISGPTRRKAEKNGTPIKEWGVFEESGTRLRTKETASPSDRNTEYQLNELCVTHRNGQHITYNVGLSRQYHGFEDFIPTKLNNMTISLKLNDSGNVDSIEEVNGQRTDTKENIEKHLDMNSRRIAILIADFISTGGKHLLRHKFESYDVGPGIITLEDKRPNKKKSAS